MVAALFVRLIDGSPKWGAPKSHETKRFKGLSLTVVSRQIIYPIFGPYCLADNPEKY